MMRINCYREVKMMNLDSGIVTAWRLLNSCRSSNLRLCLHWIAIDQATVPRGLGAVAQYTDIQMHPTNAVDLGSNPPHVSFLSGH